MKIYTRTGDKGTTGLFGGKRVAKNTPRIEAVGSIDELNSMLGVIIAKLSPRSILTREILLIQNDLFEIGAYLATPDTSLAKGKKMYKELPLYLKGRVEYMEKLVDELTEKLIPMQTFILPGGSEGGAFLHVARAVSRRAERRVITLATKEQIAQEVLMYFNRLSDLLFTMARFCNMKDRKKETGWRKR